MSKEQAKSAFELGAAQRQVLQSMAGGEAPHAQRAQALLALAGGQELESAAAGAGLTVNQARYWQGRFSSQGLAAFPDELVAQHTAVPALPRHDDPELLSAPAPSLQLASLPPAGALPPGAAAAGVLAATGQTKDKKKKKDKKGDKGKKSKKSNKSKKAKKNKVRKKGGKKSSGKKGKKKK